MVKGYVGLTLPFMIGLPSMNIWNTDIEAACGLTIGKVLIRRLP
jgi:hypothetical protein